MAAVGGRREVSRWSLLSSSYALESGPEGCGLRMFRMTFGRVNPPPGHADRQRGGAVERLDLAGWLKLSTPDKNAKPLSYYMRTATLDVAELGLSRPGVPHVSLASQ